MTNKIVILDNSVELYEHYISDEKWEKTVSFPKGGLTFNISNGTIKFFAYEDYLYRNCIISMQLPIYIVDRDGGVDGEYDDPSEIGEILDRIFPNASGTEIDLTAYLKKREAAEIYQPKGDYALRSEIPDVTDFVTDEDLVEALDDYYTKDEVDGMIPSLSGYATQQWVEDQHYITGVDLSDYATKEYVSGYTYDKSTIDEKIAQGGTFDPTQYYDKTATDALLDEKLDASAYTPTDLSNYYTKSETDDKFLTKAEIPDLNSYATKQWVINRNYVTNTLLLQYVANLQNQIDSFREIVSGCCSDTGETFTRWITMTGENDYMCSGTTKMTKEKEQQSTDGGNTWVDTGNYRMGSTILEENCAECGYLPNYKYYATYYDGDERTVDCDASNHITSAETRNYTTPLSSITSIDIGGCVSVIDDEAFGFEDPDMAYNLRSVYIPDTVATIGEAAFANNRNLNRIRLSNTITEIKARSFYSCGFTSVGGMDSIALFKIPNSVTSIGQSAFWGQQHMSLIDIPSNVKHIGNQAFGYCFSPYSADTLSITLHEGLETIGSLAFEGCFNLKKLIIPSTVTSIGGEAFNHCTSFKSLTVLATTPPAMTSLWRSGWGPDDSLNFKIYVPAASLSAFRTADGWKNYASKIEAIS